MIVREFRVEDYIQVAGMELRTWDKIEAMAMTGMDPNKALEQCILQSSEVYVAEEDGQIHGVFGVNLNDPDVGVPWFVATDKAEHNKKLIMVTGRKLVDKWMKQVTYLANYVCRYHEQSIKWLEWLGFTVDYEDELFLWSDTIPFYRFYRSV